jgi:cell division protein FtsL
MGTRSGTYQDIYIKRDNEFVSLKDDVTVFCEKYIKPVHPENWDWSIRDFENPENDPTVAEARAIANLIFIDLSEKTNTEVDLSTMNNVESIKAYLSPESKYEQFNMEEFAFALKVELEHGKIKDVNVTNNHPFLTAMIALAHMTETLTYYKRLKVMEAEGEIYEIMRKIEESTSEKEELYKQLLEANQELKEAKIGLAERLEKMDDIPTLEKIGD